MEFIERDSLLHFRQRDKIILRLTTHSDGTMGL